MGLLIYLLIHVYIVASTNAAFLEIFYGSNNYKIQCFWSEDQSSAVLSLGKNESRSICYEIEDRIHDEYGGQSIPAYPPYGMQCRCIDQGLAGCNVTTTHDSTSVVEWKCFFHFDKALQYSNLSENVSQDHISRETTKKGMLETKHSIVYTRENKPVALHCSNGISADKMQELKYFTWYTVKYPERTHLIGRPIKINHKDESVINVSFTRSEHGLIVYCEHNARTIAQWTIFVFYPPTAVDKYIEISENATIRQECNFIPGNPQTAKIRWRKGNLMLPHQQLVMTHISRHDAGNYTCESTNQFDRDGIVYVGNDTGTLRLIVFYPTTVTRFYINDMFEEQHVTLVETGNGTIHCFGEGNPAPTLSLIRYYADNQSNETLYTVNSTYLRYDLSTLGIKHSGKYICVSCNRYGEKFRTLHLIIKQLHEIANIMDVSLVTRNESSVNLRWVLEDDALFQVVQNKTCYVLYKNSEETAWINVIANMNSNVTQNSLMLDLQLINLRPDTQYEVQLIASLPAGNFSIAPSVMFRTLSFSKTTGTDIIIALIVCMVLIICIGILLRAFMKRSLRGETHGVIDSIRMDAPISPNTMNAVRSAPGLIISVDEDHYDCIEINSQDDLSTRSESVTPQIIGGTNLRDEICLQTQTIDKVEYDLLDRTGNPAEEQYNYMREIVEDSGSSNTDSIISDTCLQYLTVIDNHRFNQKDLGLATSSTA